MRCAISGTPKVFTGVLPTSDIPCRIWHNSLEKDLVIPASSGFPHIHPLLTSRNPNTDIKKNVPDSSGFKHLQRLNFYLLSTCYMIALWRMLFMGATERLNIPMGHGQRIYKNKTLTHNAQQPAQEPNLLSITNNLGSQLARNQIFRKSDCYL